MLLYIAVNFVALSDVIYFSTCVRASFVNICGVSQLTKEDIEAMSAIKKGHRRLILAGIAKAKAQNSNNASLSIADDTDAAEPNGNAPAPLADTAAANVAATGGQSIGDDKVELLSLSPALFEDMDSPVDAVCHTLDALVAELKRSVGPAEGTEMVVAEGRAQTLQDLLRSQQIDDDDCHELMDLTHALAHRDFDAAMVVYRLIEAEGADNTNVTRASWVEGLGILLRLAKVLAEADAGANDGTEAVLQETNADIGEHERQQGQHEPEPETNADIGEHERQRGQYEPEPSKECDAGHQHNHDGDNSGALASEDSGLQAADDVPDF